MAFDYGVDIRGTSGYVTDPANCTYCLTGDNYPVTRGGFTFGWTSPLNGVTDICVDRNAGIDARLAGIAAIVNNGVGILFQLRVDLASSGAVAIAVGLGDYNASHGNQGIIVKDGLGGTTKLTLAGNQNAANNYFDATNTLYTAANWPGSQAPANVTFSGTSAYVYIGTQTSGGDYTTLNHVRFTQAAAGSNIFGRSSLDGLSVFGPKQFTRVGAGIN